ncbi:hypothetical protein Tco_1499742 [Tanacetum coccineum]
MLPRVRTRSVGRPVAESRGGGTGERVGKGGRGRGPRGGNDQCVDELNGQGNGQGLGANGNVEGVNGNVEGVNGGVGGAPDFSTIIAQQLQNLLPAILALVGSIPINRGLIQAIPMSLPLQPIREATKASNLRRIPLGVQGRSHFTCFLYLIVQIRILSWDDLEIYHNYTTHDQKKMDDGHAFDEDKTIRINMLQELDNLEKIESMDLVQKERVKWEVEGDEN